MSIYLVFVLFKKIFLVTTVRLGISLNVGETAVTEADQVYNKIPGGKKRKTLNHIWVKVAQSCPTLCDPMGYSLPGSSVHGIFQATILEWIAISFSRRPSQPRNRTQVPCFTGSFFIVWIIREAYPIWYQLNCFHERAAEIMLGNV